MRVGAGPATLVIIFRKMSVDIGGMRKPYNDKKDFFDVPDLGNYNNSISVNPLTHGRFSDPYFKVL